MKRERLARGRTGLRAGFVFAGALVAGCSSAPLGEGDGQQANSRLTVPPLEDAGPPVFGEDGGPIGFDGGGPQSGPSGFWHFDDCSPKSTVLLDSSGNGANAEHRLKSSCVAGVSGLGLSVASAKDVAEVPDGPGFALSTRVAVAAWIKPAKLGGTQPIIIKERGKGTAFELLLHGQSVEFSVKLASGRKVTSTAPITAAVWSHVGAFYDGQFLFLFLDGQQVGQVDSPGTLQDEHGPIRIGASAEGSHFDGVLDDVWISTNPVTASDIEALSCIRHASTFSVSQAPTGAVSAGTTVNYSITVTDNDVGFCQPQTYFLSSNSGGFGGGGGGGDDAGGGGDDSGVIVVGADAGFFPPGDDDGGFVPADAAPPPPFDAPPPPPPFDAGPPPVDAAPPPPVDAGPPIPVGLDITVNPFESPALNPGQSFTFDLAVTASTDTDPGDYTIPFSLFSTGGDFLTSSVDFQLTAPTGCHVTTGRELMVIDPSVVDDPVRTAFNAPASNPSRGVWTFGRLMRDMATAPDQAPAFTLGLFQSWLADQKVNDLTVPARMAMQTTVLDGWPKSSDGSLDLDRAPLRLLAIVNRIDTRNLAAGNAGESRFVFGVLDASGNALQFTVIVEYALLASSEADVLSWANAWHALGALPFPSEQYNAALEALTLRFSGRGVAPSRPNGSALDQLRTNEIALAPRWELRQFGISPATGLFQEETIALTPDLNLNLSPTLASFINQNEASILAGTDVLPAKVGGAAFLAASVFNDLVTWSAPGINNNEARFQLSSNTCNGCHGPDTNTTFLQIAPRFPGQKATLSPFLTGTTAFDGVTGAPRPFNDLARRNADLESLVCAPTPGVTPKTLGNTSVAKGIRRTH